MRIKYKMATLGKIVPKNLMQCFERKKRRNILKLKDFTKTQGLSDKSIIGKSKQFYTLACHDLT